MTFETFPYTSVDDAPNEGWEIIPMFSNVIVTSRSGTEQRRALWLAPRHKISGMSWARQENAATKVDTLYRFYLARKGTFEPFILFDFDDARSWDRVLVGVGAGAIGATVYTLPCRGLTTAALGLYVGGRSVAAGGGSYTVTPAGGPNGRDLLTISTLVPVGDLVEVTFTGQRAFCVRFAEDSMSYKVFSVRVYEVGLSFIEVLDEGYVPPEP